MDNVFFCVQGRLSHLPLNEQFSQRALGEKVELPQNPRKTNIKNIKKTCIWGVREGEGGVTIHGCKIINISKTASKAKLPIPTFYCT